jgi:hypothetical protein
MSVRVRKWTNTEGEERQAYVVQYSIDELDNRGKRKRSIRTFETREEAEDFELQMQRPKKRKHPLPLTPEQVANAKPGDKLNDGHGLRLDVDQNGNAGWIFRYTSPITTKERYMGLGSTNDVTLTQAREAAASARVLIRDGKDPIDNRNIKRTLVRSGAISETKINQQTLLNLAILLRGTLEAIEKELAS